MIIKIKGKNGERQSPTVKIDTKNCHYPYAIRNALKLALELDGYDKGTINDTLGLQEDVKVAPEEEKTTSENDKILGSVFVPKNWSKIHKTALTKEELDREIKREIEERERVWREESIHKSVKRYLDIIGPVIAAKTITSKENSEIDPEPALSNSSEPQSLDEIEGLEEFRKELEIVMQMKYPRNQKYKRQLISEVVENLRFQGLTKEFKEMIHTASKSKNADDLRIDKNGVIH
jgi:hypothetical protein